jgi:hypothetical protein
MKEDEKIKKQKREERLIELEEKNLKNLEKKEEKRNKWIANKEENNLMKRRQMQDLSFAKLERHKKLLDEEEDKQKIITELRRDIAIQKGYGDPYAINPINYSLVEESPPKYSIKGRYAEHRSRVDDMQNLVLGTNIELLNQIKIQQKNQSLPNFNYVKPRLPSIVFNRAERFPNPKPTIDDSLSTPLFINGIFKPPEREDFICIEPMSNLSQRGNNGNSHSKSPSSKSPKKEKIYNIRTKIRRDNDKIKEKEKNKGETSFDKNKSLNLQDL